MNIPIPEVVHNHTRNPQFPLEATLLHPDPVRKPQNYKGVVPNIGSNKKFSTAVVHRIFRHGGTRPHAYPQAGLLEQRSSITMGAGQRKGRA